MPFLLLDGTVQVGSAEIFLSLYQPLYVGGIGLYVLSLAHRMGAGVPVQIIAGWLS